MKKSFLLLLSFLMLLLVSGNSFGQGAPVGVKGDGQPPLPQVVPVEPITPILPVENKNGGLKVPLDGTFTQVTFLPDYTGQGGAFSDDGSSALITLPFTFCFYGTNQNGFYINNNGNISFGGAFSAFTSSGFPINDYPMLAPFWADVDTRTGLGSVWYKITTNPNRVVVIWDQVGYYNQQGDKRNTFELIFTDGADPLLAGTNNVGLSYGSMQWTTGSASGGSGGFGGTPATVGVNKGDGIAYALVGRFDNASANYDGPGGANDGVAYLTDKYFEFDACQSTIIIPPPIPTLGEWGLILLGLALLGFGTFYIMRMRG